MNEREEWLKLLKVGDRVAIESGTADRNFSIGVVTKITPSRNKFEVKYRWGTLVCNKYGAVPRGKGDRSFFYPPSIEPLTSEIIAGIKHLNALGELRKLIDRLEPIVRRDQLSNEQIALLTTALQSILGDEQAAQEPPKDV